MTMRKHYAKIWWSWSCCYKSTNSLSANIDFFTIVNKHNFLHLVVFLTHYDFENQLHILWLNLLEFTHFFSLIWLDHVGFSCWVLHMDHQYECLETGKYFFAFYFTLSQYSYHLFAFPLFEYSFFQVYALYVWLVDRSISSGLLCIL